MNETTTARSADPTLNAALHGCPVATRRDGEVPETGLLSPLTIRGITLRNRIVMSPMCQYGDPLARIARFVYAQAAVAGIQLAHAGRKASWDLPWNGGASVMTPAAGGRPVYGSRRSRRGDFGYSRDGAACSATTRNGR